MYDNNVVIQHVFKFSLNHFLRFLSYTCVKIL